MSRVKQIKWEVIPSPDKRVPLIEVHFEVPEDAKGPDALQLELLERIRIEFPQLWRAVLEDLKRNALKDLDPEDVLAGGSVFIPAWDYIDHEPGEVRSTANYFWQLSP